MLVRRIQEFIQVVSLNGANFNREDLAFIDFLKEKFSSLDPAKELSNEEVDLIESALAHRWDNTIDASYDYTSFSSAQYKEWISLAKSLGKRLNKPFLAILIPGLQPYSPDLDLNSVENLNDLYLGHDDKTVYSVPDLMEKLEHSVKTFSTSGKLNSYKTITIKELHRIRNKEPYEENQKSESDFWYYFINELVPLWRTDQLKIELTSALCEVIHTYFDCDENKDFNKFKESFKNFCNYLNTFSAEDINAFYSITLEYEQQKIYLVEILVDCLAMPETEDLTKKLNIVLDSIYTLSSSSLLKHRLLDCPQAKHYFEFYNLQELLNALSLTTLPSFNSKAALFKHKFISQNNFNSSQLDELTDLLSMHWRKVIDNSDNLLIQDDKSTLTIWHCLVRQFAPLWKKNGELPRHVLPELLNVIDAYYQSLEVDNNKYQLKRAVIDLINTLKLSKVEDSNYLYSTLFKVRGKQFYLLELLIEILQHAENLAPKLKAVAQWIYELDHSLIASHNQLASVYRNLQAGPYYNLNKLENLLNALSLESASTKLKEKLAKIKQYIRRIDQLNAYLVQEIVELFTLRWQEIIDTPLDYTRLIDGANESWISLAQYLEGAQLLNFLSPPNYYKLLIPTLTHETDFISGEKLTVYPLTHYILAEQGDELIFLPNCVSNFTYRKTFYNCNHFKPFTAVEKERIKHSLPHFVRCFNEAEEENHDIPVSRKTVLEVKKLVEGTLYPEGLYLGNDITASQLDYAENSYKEFLKYLNNLPEEEKLNLLSQTILFEGRKITFLEVLEQVLDKGECLVVYAQYLLKFVLDYDPFVRFPVEWEHKVRIDTMRPQSEQKVFSDYDHISDEEAIKRILILGVSLMTHTFKYLPLTGVSFSLWDCSNTITKTGNDIMNLIKKPIFSGDFTQARFIYASLMESVIKPAFISDGYRVTFLRYPDTIAWLSTIIDGSLFRQSSITCFEPDTLLSVLWSYKDKSSKIMPQIENFLEEIISTLLQTQNDYLKWIRINIKFSEFVKEIPKEESEELLSQLRAKIEPVPSDTLVKIIRDFLVHRIAWQIARAPKGFGLFKESAINTTMYQEAAKRFHQELEAFNSQNQAWYELPSMLAKIARTILINFEISSLPKYFSKFETNISTLEYTESPEEIYSNSPVLSAVS
ncbi:hypothetical protein ACNVED_12530 [Legionella sp. D16C41]|uniref:hypothetical protein n=1 Tax=Legionella sp. D16C41 TaxID=3402688 RepID=UPI003AF57D1F